MVRFLRSQILICTILCLVSIGASAARHSGQTKTSHSNGQTTTKVLTGQDAFTDAAHESPGTRRHLTVNDLPSPNEKESVDNGPSMAPKPPNAWPIAPKGFKVEQYTTGLDNPRLIRTAPNGDLFVAESQPGKILVFRGVTPDGKPQQTSVFAEGLHQPFGIAFYPSGPNPKYVYIGNTDGIVRFPYQSGDLKARGYRFVTLTEYMKLVGPKPVEPVKQAAVANPHHVAE